MQSIAVIDYGMGNLRSVAKAVESVVSARQSVKVTDNADIIRQADRIIFPGQGAAAACMQALYQHQLFEVITEVAKQKPFLGICMGLQVLMQYSSENNGIDCLRCLPGDVVSFSKQVVGLGEQTLKIPHMGWNSVRQVQQHRLWSGIPDESYFYFVHSYYVKPDKDDLVVGATDYGLEFASVLAKDNIFATQFHPEKSAKNGLRLLANFLAWDGQA